MTLDDRIALAKDLIAQRDDIDARLQALFAGGDPPVKAARKCKTCGEAGHRSDNCPQKFAVAEAVGTASDADDSH